MSEAHRHTHIGTPENSPNTHFNTTHYSSRTGLMKEKRQETEALETFFDF